MSAVRVYPFNFKCDVCKKEETHHMESITITKETPRFPPKNWDGWSTFRNGKTVTYHRCRECRGEWSTINHTTQTVLSIEDFLCSIKDGIYVDGKGHAMLCDGQKFKHFPKIYPCDINKEHSGFVPRIEEEMLKAAGPYPYIAWESNE